MRNRQISFWILMWVNVLILAVTAVPHHHHNGIPCLHALFEDVPEHCGDTMPDDDRCGDDCLTKFEFRETAQQNDHSLFSSPFFGVSDEIFPNTTLLKEGVSVGYVPFFLLFKSRFIAPSLGWRAPPVSVLV